MLLVAALGIVLAAAAPASAGTITRGEVKRRADLHVHRPGDQPGEPTLAAATCIGDVDGQHTTSVTRPGSRRQRAGTNCTVVRVHPRQLPRQRPAASRSTSGRATTGSQTDHAILADDGVPDPATIDGEAGNDRLEGTDLTTTRSTAAMAPTTCSASAARTRSTAARATTSCTARTILPTPATCPTPPTSATSSWVATTTTRPSATWVPTSSPTRSATTRCRAASDTITDTSGNNTITRRRAARRDHHRAGNDTVEGGASNDTIVDSGGTNTLRGGAGADTITGGPGNDTICGASIRPRATRRTRSHPAAGATRQRRPRRG